MVYPVIILLLTTFEMLGVIYFILPKMEGLFNSFDDPPALTMFVLGASQFMRENILYIVVAIIVFFCCNYEIFQDKNWSGFQGQVTITYSR
jgi:type II secretory pathway component PulF